MTWVVVRGNVSRVDGLCVPLYIMSCCLAWPVYLVSSSGIYELPEAGSFELSVLYFFFLVFDDRDRWM